MLGLPNPLGFLSGGARNERPEGDHGKGRTQTFIGGRHGSPSVLVSFPFSRIDLQETDEDVRRGLAELAENLARLADQVAVLAGDGSGIASESVKAEAGRLSTAAEQLKARLDPDRPDSDAEEER